MQGEFWADNKYMQAMMTCRRKKLGNIGLNSHDCHRNKLHSIAEIDAPDNLMDILGYCMSNKQWMLALQDYTCYCDK